MRVLALALEPALLAMLLLVLARRRPGAQLAVGALALAVGPAHSAVPDGHPAESVIPLLWVLAGRAARSGRTLRAGLLGGPLERARALGLLGVAVLALAPPREQVSQSGVRLNRLERALPRAQLRVLSGAALAAGALGLLLAPFVLGADFHMFDYRWPISDGTPLSVVATVGTPLVLAVQTLGLAGLATLLADGRALAIARTRLQPRTLSSS